jgi:3-hydroxybutyrate dehydrogenase
MLKGKTALVTGSTSGIGLGIAKALARQGANIVLNGFGDVEGPKAEVAALGVKVAYHGADMSKPAEIEDMMKFAASASSAGWTSWSTTPASSTWPHVEDFPVERWDAIIAINLSSAFHATRLALPAMKAPTGAASSTWPRSMAWWPRPEIGLCGAKHGIVGLTKVTALETPPPA